MKQKIKDLYAVPEPIEVDTSGKIAIQFSQKIEEPEFSRILYRINKDKKRPPSDAKPPKMRR